MKRKPVSCGTTSGSLNVCVINPQRRGERWRTEKIFEELTDKSFLNFMKTKLTDARSSTNPNTPKEERKLQKCIII